MPGARLSYVHIARTQDMRPDLDLPLENQTFFFLSMRVLLQP